MKYPIVSVETTDGLTLHGLLNEPEDTSKTIIIHLHGCGGNFYGNRYFGLLAKAVCDLGVAYLQTNNRGAGVYEFEKGTVPHGVALEKFEDCLLDIDAWIEFALQQGFENIILEGHSYGTEKSVYYMNKGKYADKIIGIILFGFSDNVGYQAGYEKQSSKDYRSEAQRLVDEGKPYHLLDDLDAYCGEMPVSAQTYLDTFHEDSEDAKALPFHKGQGLEYFRNITVPMLGVISDNEAGEYTIIPIKEAAALLQSENELAEVQIIPGTDHVFTGKEEEMVEIVTNFVQRRLLEEARTQTL
jgi:pimeloyl-ACP methyl ester carboxylesterase